MLTLNLAHLSTQKIRQAAWISYGIYVAALFSLLLFTVNYFLPQLFYLISWQDEYKAPPYRMEDEIKEYENATGSS